VTKELKHIQSNEKVSTIARVLYLFLCENQAEINAYSKAFPSITADVMFFCWKENCNHSNFSQLKTFYVAHWSRRISKHQSFVRFDAEVNYTKIEPRVFILNEQQMNLSGRTTWTTARNFLFERALMEEHLQGWRWAYWNFVDGDVETECPLAEKFLETNEDIDGDESLFVRHYRLLMNKTINKDPCYILIDAFLLSVSPAIAVFANTGAPIIFDDLLTQIVYHVDAIFNAFHRDAIPFVLPYCARYDGRSWWKSQAILIYRSLCLYGHVIQFNAIHIIGQKHRRYPRKGNPFIVDSRMNLVPLSLIPLQKYLQQTRVISPLVLRHYGGWSVEMTNKECRQRHTYVDPLTCKVSGNLR
jgi:hypothetical protein